MVDVGGYYEAKIQVRPSNAKVIDYILDQVEKKNGVSVVKILNIQKGSGVDIYLTSWRYAVLLGQKLRRVFGGETAVTRSLYGTNKHKSKTVYRVTVLFRLKTETTD